MASQATCVGIVEVLHAYINAWESTRLETTCQSFLRSSPLFYLIVVVLLCRMFLNFNFFQLIFRGVDLMSDTG